MIGYKFIQVAHIQIFCILFSTLTLFSCHKENLFDSRLNGKAGTFENNRITVDGEKRYYRMVVSEKLNLHVPNKIIFAFHGLGIDSKDLMPTYSKLNELAEQMNAIIVYPNSQNGSWGLNQRQIEKDLNFFDRLLNDIKLHYAIDKNNIHITGMSNGAYFCHILAKNHSEEIASVSAHSGMIGLEFMFGINSKRKYPVLLIHGKNDPIFNIKTARDDLNKYRNENHKAKLTEVDGLGHEWATKININDSIAIFMHENPLN